MRSWNWLSNSGSKITTREVKLSTANRTEDPLVMYAQQLVRVSHANPRETAISFQRFRDCALFAEDVAARLRTATEVAGFWLLHEIDPQALLSSPPALPTHRA